MASRVSHATRRTTKRRSSLARNLKDFPLIRPHITSQDADRCANEKHYNLLDLLGKVRKTSVKLGAVRYVKYKAVLHNPLTFPEAERCLRDLMMKLKGAISEYHSLRYAHQDIRLENVCFNNQYEPVLIDIDRSVDIETAAVIHGESCMYVPGMTPEQIDWIQLGWLAAWVIYYDDDYHGRKFGELPVALQDDLFLFGELPVALQDDLFLFGELPVALQDDLFLFGELPVALQDDLFLFGELPVALQDDLFLSQLINEGISIV